MQKCTYCGRENDDGSTACKECGTSLVSDRADVDAVQDDLENPRRALGEKLMLRGILWLIGGLMVTVFSYFTAVNSPYGGHYVVAYGAIIFGIAQFFRGRAAVSGPDSDDQAQELLDTAAHLESVDRAKAIELYAEIAKRFPGTRVSEEAQRNIQTLITYRNENVG
jgi:hypothetical protein